ncbi:MAG: ComEA family DNA-binding protein [Gemmatimonadales bacterium]|jgi:competence ComEA-like helix-hairpin-helix protein|nr:MAG: ComEA family DNA-binding protein [Gemmatimonadales bacterium]
MEPTERRAIVMLLLLGVIGQGVRWGVGRPGEPPGQVALMPAERRGSPTAHRDSALAAARPMGPGETLDPDRATIAELLRLPKVGPALARAIVADREAKGPFQSAKGLDRVPGIGPKLLEAVSPYLTFPGGAIGGGGDEAGRRPGEPGPDGGRLDLNAATDRELESLPGIGPALAGRIISYRESHGGFADIGELRAVPGIGSRLLGRLTPLLTVR